MIMDKNYRFFLILFIAIFLVVGLFFVFNSNSPNDKKGKISKGLNVKEFNLIAKQFEFVPGVIKVNEGDKVILHIESIDVEHGIGIFQFGVNKILPVGQNVTVEFVANKKGTYYFFCTVYCGVGHGNMRGKLIVN